VRPASLLDGVDPNRPRSPTEAGDPARGDHAPRSRDHR
jgi:hypothetical protein